LSKKNNTTWLIEKSKSLFGDLFDYSETEYLNAKTKIKFYCKKHNHGFLQTSNNHLNSKYPCILCLKESKAEFFSDGIESFKKKIKSIYGNRFNFSQANYVNQRTPITLICVKHNVPVTKEPQLFISGHGCNLCNQEEIRKVNSSQKLAEIDIYVKKLSGKCLSKNYLDNESKLEFECEFGHRFEKSWSAVKNSLRWCPKCSSNKLIGETLARLILEHLLKMELPSVYIKEMEGLQLDGYNEINKIAFEYQGYQHFTEGSHFHEDVSRFNSQLNRDKLKKSLCAQNGITLIEIFEFKTIRLGRIDLFVEQVKEKLIELKITFSHAPFELDLVELYRGRKSDLYERAKEIVKQQNGFIQDFIGSESKHHYYCHKGHEVKNRTLGVIINSKANCPECESEEKFKRIKGNIESRGGKILDLKLKTKGLSESYYWICNNGHKNKTKGQYLFDGSWCSHCQSEKKKVKLNFEDIDQFKIDVTSGMHYQKDLPKKYGIGSSVYRRLIKEFGLTPTYLPQERQLQKKRTKGKLLQIDPSTLEVLKTYDYLGAVKYDKENNFTPEGIRHQMKNFKKAYGYFWSREEDLVKTLEQINNDNREIF
jgi:hypothetical protein